MMLLGHGTVYGAQYYTVAPAMGLMPWREMETWCEETFGKTGSLWQETKNLTPGPHRRWYMNNSKFWFREEADRSWFVLRWS
jgi:hypothetical protein